MNLCLTGLSPWKWHFKLWNTKHSECFVLCSKQCHTNWTFLIISAFLTPSYSSVKWHSLWNILWLRESSFPSSGGVTKCHTQCLLCNSHQGVYIIYSMVRPWLSVVVLEDLVLFVYLKNVSVLLWTCKHQDGKKNTILLFTGCLPYRNPLQREKGDMSEYSTGWLASVQCLHLHPWQSSEWPLLTAVLDSVSQAQPKPGEQHDRLGC